MYAYQNKERFNNLLEIKRIRRRLETGKEVKRLFLKYFTRELLNTGKLVKFEPPADYLAYYLDWQNKLSDDPDDREEWKEEITTNYSEYYPPIDSVYIKLGKRLYDAMKKLPNIKVVGLLGGSVENFKYGIQQVEKFRRFGKEIFELIERLWPSELKKKGYKKLDGRGIEFGDFKKFLAKYTKREPLATIENLEQSLSSNEFGKYKERWFTDQELKYLFLGNLARNSVFTIVPMVNSIMETGNTPEFTKKKSRLSKLSEDDYNAYIASRDILIRDITNLNLTEEELKNAKKELAEVERHLSRYN